MIRELCQRLMFSCRRDALTIAHTGSRSLRVTVWRCLSLKPMYIPNSHVRAINLR